MASNFILFGSTKIAPNADILSISSFRPALYVATDISSIGLRIPELVSQ